MSHKETTERKSFGIIVNAISKGDIIDSANQFSGYKGNVLTKALSALYTQPHLAAKQSGVEFEIKTVLESQVEENFLVEVHANIVNEKLFNEAFSERYAYFFAENHTDRHPETLDKLIAFVTELGGGIEPEHMGFREMGVMDIPVPARSRHQDAAFEM